ncbi:MAG: SPOR domain-containing protein [Candidatus Dadabacteria bacterium]|nr:MAG: SPOR domain-containing protein [Candidatus Dadabacteria bacterium]
MADRITKQKWSIRLGPVQAAIFLAVVLGSMCAAFYLGLLSGNKAGFEMAQRMSASQQVRLPITNTDDVNEAKMNRITEKLYASLGKDTDGTIDYKTIPTEPETKVEGVKIETIEPTSLDAESGMRDTTPKATKESSKTIAELLSGKPNEDRAEDAIKGEGLTLGDIESKKTALSKQEKEDTADVSHRENTLDHRERRSTNPVEATKNLSHSSPPSAAKSVPQSIKDDQNSSALTEKVKHPLKKKAHPVQNKLSLKKARHTAEQNRLNAKKVTTLSKYLKSHLRKGWYVQIKTVGSAQNAASLAEKLKRSGYRAIVQYAKVRGATYYRVLVGPEENERLAKRLLVELKREKGLPPNIFARWVK